MSDPDPGDGGIIIIKGGSVDLDYDESIYPKDPNDPKKHKNDNRKVTRILVQDEHDVTKYDSNGENPLKWKVTVFTR
jgi:hypothetical protein